MAMPAAATAAATTANVPQTGAEIVATAAPIAAMPDDKAATPGTASTMPLRPATRRPIVPRGWPDIAASADCNPIMELAAVRAPIAARPIVL